MNLSRRKFFGAAAVAPFAAKQAVSALQYEAKMQASTSGMLGGLNSIKDGACADAVAPLGPQDWMQHEIKMLMERRKKIEAYPVPTFAIATAAAMRIDGLRSVSGPVRSMMIAEDRLRRERATELSYIDSRIAEYREKLGPLAMLIG